MTYLPFPPNSGDPRCLVRNAALRRVNPTASERGPCTANNRSGFLFTIASNGGVNVGIKTLSGKQCLSHHSAIALSSENEMIEY